MGILSLELVAPNKNRYVVCFIIIIKCYIGGISRAYQDHFPKFVKDPNWGISGSLSEPFIFFISISESICINLSSEIYSDTRFDRIAHLDCSS